MADTVNRLSPKRAGGRACAAALFAFVLLAAGPVCPSHAAAKPNVVFIVADDLGYGETGCQGNPEIPTPHIDSIAKGGVRFTDGYVTCSVCSPSRAALLTGRYQTRFGHELNAIGRQNLDPSVGLPLMEVTLADRLKTAGYATGAVGKWHLGATSKFHPQQRGFDEFFGFLHEGHSYAPRYFPGLVTHLRVKEPAYDDANPILRGTEKVEEKEYMTDALTREAVAFIQKHKDAPFFLYLAYNAVHSPMETSPKYFDRFRTIKDPHRRVFAAMLSALDDGVGTVLDQLRALGLDDNTLVVFLSDNGGPTEELTSSNKPLRGGKGTLYEGGVRIPFLVKWPRALRGGRVYEQPVIATDVFATALAAAGVEPAPGRPPDGVDLVPFLAGKADGVPHRTLFWRYGAASALRKGQWKLVRRGKEAELFDLATDKGETTDRARERPEVLKEVRGDWDAINQHMVKPLWGR